MAKKVKITDKPTKKALSKDAAKGVVGGATTGIKTASTVYQKTVKSGNIQFATTDRTIDRTASTQALAGLGKVRGSSQ